METIKQAIITIAEDPNNKGNEQYKDYQLNGYTYSVAIGKSVKVPLWVAKIAKEVGDIPDYIEI